MTIYRHGISRFFATLPLVAAAVVCAQPPAAQTEGSPAQRQTQQSRAVMIDRTKSQVIYKFRSRENAEALHAQSKAIADTSLPVDGSMPISLQLSRSAANAEAAAARAEVAQPEPRVIRRAKKSKTQSVNPAKPGSDRAKDKRSGD